MQDSYYPSVSRIRYKVCAKGVSDCGSSMEAKSTHGQLMYSFSLLRFVFPFGLAYMYMRTCSVHCAEIHVHVQLQDWMHSLYTDFTVCVCRSLWLCFLP